MRMWWRASPTIFRRGRPAIAVPGCWAARISDSSSPRAGTSPHSLTRPEIPRRPISSEPSMSPILPRGRKRLRKTGIPGGRTLLRGSPTAAGGRRTRRCRSAGPACRRLSPHRAATCSKSDNAWHERWTMTTDLEEPADLIDLVGQQVGTTDWMKVTQEQLNPLADATGHQWIHTDPQRGAHSPFKGTIAHGYLTPLLAPVVISEVLQICAVTSALKDGLNK